MEEDILAQNANASLWMINCNGNFWNPFLNIVRSFSTIDYLNFFVVSEEIVLIWEWKNCLLFKFYMKVSILHYFCDMFWWISIIDELGLCMFAFISCCMKLVWLIEMLLLVKFLEKPGILFSLCFSVFLVLIALWLWSNIIVYDVACMVLILFVFNLSNLSTLQTFSPFSVRCKLLQE